jgi:hypothetical protein
MPPFRMHCSTPDATAPVHSGLIYLNRFYGLKAERVWSRIKEASQSVEGVQELMMEVQRNIREYGLARENGKCSGRQPSLWTTQESTVAILPDFNRRQLLT